MCVGQGEARQFKPLILYKNLTGSIYVFTFSFYHPWSFYHRAAPPKKKSHLNQIIVIHAEIRLLKNKILWNIWIWHHLTCSLPKWICDIHEQSSLDHKPLHLNYYKAKSTLFFPFTNNGAGTYIECVGPICQYLPRL